MGVPAVVQDLGSISERVSDDETGFVATDAHSFAAAAVRLLTDDDVWRRQHLEALDRRPGLGWEWAARAFEELIP
jgi:glycosyltransferase involved in cell wall biosynthesis